MSSPVPELHGSRVTLRPVEEKDILELRRIVATPEVHARWGDGAAAPEWPFDDPGTIAFSVIHNGVVCGLVQYGEEPDPMYRHASIDIFLDPKVQGRRIGRETVWLIADYLIHQRGHHRLTIDPAADNEPAIRCYQAVGFRPVGVMRLYERDADGDNWHDGLLMDLLASELKPRP